MKYLGTNGDTLSPWPTMQFVFSETLKDSGITLVIFPDPGSVYTTRLNHYKDTLLLTVTGVLKGNTQYTISLKHKITAQNGSILYPNDVLFNLWTHPTENEPNNSLVLADTLIKKMYGILSPLNDTDFFMVTRDSTHTIYLKSHHRMAGFILKNSADSVLTIQNNLNDFKEFHSSTIPFNPFYLGVFSLSDNTARYELGISVKK